MADVVHDAADQEITRLARAMAKEFKAAHDSMAKRLEEQLADYERELKQWKQDVKSGKRTDKEFKAWKSARCADLGRAQGLVDLLARDLVEADQRATEHIRGALPAVYAENYNYGSYQAQQGKVIPTFALYDEGTVANLLDEDKQLLPAPKVNVPKDMSWNASHVRSALTQSFLTGESIPDMAARLRGVADMNTRSSIRIARTAITGAENRARVDSYVSANDMGIECEKQWMAALDGRTRDSHRKLDGTHVKADEKFDNGCRFPGDPDAPAGETYNCRCTLVVYIPGHNVMAGREQKRIGSLSYEEWKAGVKEQQPEAASGRSLEKFLELPSVQKSIEKSGTSKSKLMKAMREEIRNQGFKDLRAFKTLPKSRQQGVLGRAIKKGTPRKDATIAKVLKGKGIEKEHAKAISKLGVRCKNKDAAKAFEKYIGRLKVDAPERASEAYFSPLSGAIHIDMNRTALGFEERPDKAPYQIFFHEFGHFVDWQLGNQAEHASQAAGLGETASNEIIKTIIQIKRSQGYKTVQEAEQHLTAEVIKLYCDSPSLIGGLSDIIHGATLGDCCDNNMLPKHKLDYWIDGGMDALSTETFAHFYETATANPEALETLKRYLPKTYNAYKAIIKGI